MTKHNIRVNFEHISRLEEVWPFLSYMFTIPSGVWLWMLFVIILIWVRASARLLSQNVVTNPPLYFPLSLPQRYCKIAVCIILQSHQDIDTGTLHTNTPYCTTTRGLLRFNLVRGCIEEYCSTAWSSLSMWGWEWVSIPLYLQINEQHFWNDPQYIQVTPPAENQNKSNHKHQLGEYFQPLY